MGDLSDIAGSALQKERQTLFAKLLAQSLGKIERIVSAELSSTHDSAMAGEIDNEPQHAPIFVLGCDDANIWVSWSCWANYVGIALPWVSLVTTVFHDKPSVESDAVFVPDSHANFGFPLAFVSLDNCFSNLLGNEATVAVIGFALKSVGNRTTAMGVGCSNHDVLGWNSTSGLS
jgi:hypothetical protein